MKKNRSPSARKRTFLLLEVLMALALVTVCLTPIVASITSLRVAKLKAERVLDQERRRSMVLCEIKQQFFEGNIALEEGIKGVIQETHYRIEKVESHPRKKCFHVTLALSRHGVEDHVHLFVVNE